MQNNIEVFFRHFCPYVLQACCLSIICHDLTMRITVVDSFLQEQNTLQKWQDSFHSMVSYMYWSNRCWNWGTTNPESWCWKTKAYRKLWGDTAEKYTNQILILANGTHFWLQSWQAKINQAFRWLAKLIKCFDIFPSGGTLAVIFNPGQRWQFLIDSIKKTQGRNYETKSDQQLVFNHPLSASKALYLLFSPIPKSTLQLYNNLSLMKPYLPLNAGLISNKLYLRRIFATF